MKSVKILVLLVVKNLSSRYPTTQNFFDPLLTSDGQPFAQVKYKSIVKEQVTLSYLTNGGVTYGDSDNMTPYERELAIQAMQEILDKSNKKPNNPNPYKNDPKSRMNA